ncbi:MAG: magnesium chelatase [Bacillota bacterium]
MSLRAPVRHQGNESLFLAVEMSLVSTLAGVPLHIHAEGLRGTGKTTVMRWAKGAMPSIRRIADCQYYCDPQSPRCPQHRAAASGGPFASEELPMPFVEIGHGAKLGTVLGSIDLGRLTGKSRPEAALLPGSIPMANRGIIFIDEVNRLAETAPEITDVLLSVMGTKPGLVKIEEVGLPPCEIEVSASVWAASNPDEDPGPLEDIRRQLADRFDLVVPVQRPSDPAVVERLLFGGASPADEDAPLLGLAQKAARLKDVRVPPYVVRYVAQLYVHRNVESLRAVEALELACRLHAALHGKDEVSFDEMLAVIPLVLRHRVEPAALSEILKDLDLRKAAGAQVKPPAPPPDPGAGQDQATVAGQDHLPGPDGSAKPDDRGPGHPADQTPPGDDAFKGRKTSWFEKLVERYRNASARQPAGGTSRGSAEMQRLPDPATMKPVSPPDRARRITSISWPDLVTPPDWKDHLP